MARDSSPFAQRLKALANRAGRQAPGDEAPAPVVPPAGSAAEDSASLPDPGPQPTAPVDPDEQPTGEFPAVSLPSTDAEQPAAQDPSPALQPDVQPPVDAATTTGSPDPQPFQQQPEPGAWSPDPQPFQQQPEPGAWSPDPQPFQQQPEQPTPGSDVQQGADQTTEPPPTSTWSVVPPPPVKPPESVPTPVAENAPAVKPPSVRPIWLDPPANTELPVPAPAVDAVSAEPEARSDTGNGPTLSPPVVPKKPEDVPESADQAAPNPDPVDSPAATFPAPTPGSTTDWTPTALHEALSIPEDDQPFGDSAPTPVITDASASADADARVPTADAADDSALAGAPELPEPLESATQSTLVTDAVPSTPKRRKLGRPGFLKRPASDAEDRPVPSADSAPAIEATGDPEPEPETTQFVAPVPEAALAEVAATPPTDPASAGDDATATKADPGSITSRFRLIGRRSKAGTPDADSPTESTTTPVAEPVPEPEPVLLTAEPVPYKPTFAERAALRRRAKSLRGRRDAGLLELGAIVLDQSRFGDPSGGTLVRRRTAELADLDSEIASIEIALDDERSAETVKQLGVVHCTSCGSLLGPADRFCSQCGAAHPGSGAESGSQPPAS